MPREHPRPRLPAAPGPPTLRERLLRLPGWTAADAAPAALEAGGVRYTVVPLARRSDLVALSCEPPSGDPLPPYPARRALLRHLRRTHPRHLAVFTDASRLLEVWCWVGADQEADTPVHQRVHRPGSVEPLPLPPPVHPRPGSHPGRAARPGPDDPGSVVANALLRSVDRRLGEGRASGDPGRLVRKLLADAPGPETVRAVWRCAVRLRVLDPACGSGDWLLGALAALESIYLACLDQMRIWLDDAAIDRRPRRPEYLRDFRAALARGEDPRRGGRLRVVREMIVLRTLYGADPDAAAAASCRRLHGRLRAGGAGALPADACNVRAGRVGEGLARRADLARALVGRPDAAAALRRLTEEAGTIARAERFIREMRLEHGMPADALAGGLRSLRRRREALGRELDPLTARSAGVAGAAATRDWIARRVPLHPLAEWPSVALRGGFHLVRAAPA